MHRITSMWYEVVCILAIHNQVNLKAPSISYVHKPVGEVQAQLAVLLTSWHPHSGPQTAERTGVTGKHPHDCTCRGSEPWLFISVITDQLQRGPQVYVSVCANHKEKCGDNSCTGQLNICHVFETSIQICKHLSPYFLYAKPHNMLTDNAHRTLLVCHLWVGLLCLCIAKILHTNFDVSG